MISREAVDKIACFLYKDSISVAETIVGWLLCYGVPGIVFNIFAIFCMTSCGDCIRPRKSRVMKQETTVKYFFWKIYTK